MKEENSSPHGGRVAAAHAEASPARETPQREGAPPMAERMAVLEEVFRTAPSFLHVLHGPEFIFEFANEAYYQLVGRRDLIGRPAFEVLSEAARGGYQALISRVLETGEPFYGRELRVTLARTPGGPLEERIIDLNYQPLVDPDGSCTRVLGHGTDVTERVREREQAEQALRQSEAALRESEAALRESEARYRTLFESMDEGFCLIEVLFDPSGQPVDYRFLEVNPAFAVHTGITDGAGHTMREFAPGHEPHWFEIYGRVALTGEPVRFERTAEEFGRFYDVYAFRVGKPEQRRVAVLFNDVSERKQTSDALQEANRRKDEFLATLAHELRNPLAPLVTAMEVLRLRADDPAAVERARDTIGRQVEHMRRLIDDLLDVARITRGMVDLHLETVDLASVLTDAVHMAHPRIDRRRQQLTVLVPLEAVRLEGDPHRLIQVITNLLTNAAKFTPQGGEITVTAERNGAEAVIRVRDNGKGIPAEMLPHVFDLFTQVNPSIDRGEGGLGLGLTLVQKLVQMHGGQVEAYSAGTGLGSEFSVRLPIHPVEPRPDGPAASTTAAVDVERRLRVLVVDDNVDAADTLADLLPIWGHEVRVAYTGPEALAAARNWLPHVILLDIGLPGMDGYAVARQIQEAPALAAVRLVALTGFGQAEDRQRSRDTGFDAHLTKPVDLDELRNVLEAQPPWASMHS